MAQRPPINNSLSGHISDSLMQLTGASKDGLLKDMETIQTRMDQLGATMIKTSKRNARKIVSDGQQTAAEFLSSLDKTSEKAGEAVAENMEKGFEKASGAAKKHGKKIKDSLEEAVPKPSNLMEQFSKIFSKHAPKSVKNLMPNFATGGLDLKKQFLDVDGAAEGAAKGVGAVTAAVEDLGISLGVLETVALGPIGVLLVAVGTYIAGLITHANQLNNELADLSRNTAGNRDLLKGFTEQLDKVSVATHLSHDQILKLGQSFAEAGYPITEAQQDLQDYMTLAGTGVKLFGLSNDAAASYARSLMAAGKSAAEATEDWDSMYKIMVQTNQTTKELVDSMDQGKDVWREFGAATGAGLSSFQKGVLQTSALFRSLNLDVKDVGKSVADMLADPNKMIGQANFVASALGMSADNVLSEMYSNTAAAKQHLYQAALKNLAGSGAFGGNLGASDEERQKQEGSQFGQRTNYRRFAIQNLAKMSNANPDEINKVLEDYQGWAHGQGVNVQGTQDQKIAAFFAQRQMAASLSPGGTPVGGIKSGMESVTATTGGALDNLNNSFTKFMNEQAEPMVKGIENISRGMNTLVSFFTGVKVPTIDKVIPQAGKGLHELGRNVARGFQNAVKNSPIAATFAAGNPNSAPALMDKMAKVTSDVTSLSSRHEGGVGTVSKGYFTRKDGSTWQDPGGVSYGLGQMTSSAKSGDTVARYVNWLKTNDPARFKALAGGLGTEGNAHGALAQSWQQLAAQDPAGFATSQKQFLTKTYLQKSLLDKVGPLANNPAIQAAIYSGAIQHGVGGMNKILSHRNFAGMNAEQVLRAIYAGREAAAPKQAERYHVEMKEALNMLGTKLDHLVAATNGVKNNQEQPPKTVKRQMMAAGSSTAAAQHHALTQGVV